MTDHGRAAAVPAAERNREPIRDVLSSLPVLAATTPADGLLEVASGFGVHALFVSPSLPLTWQPTELTHEAVEALRSATRDAARIKPAVLLDASSPPEQWPTWPEGGYACVLAINVTHISRWEVTLGLLHGAAFVLKPGGLLCIYGPFFLADRPTAPSNLAFDENLRARDPGWGLRSVEAVSEAALAVGLKFDQARDLPANNLFLIFSKK